MILFLLIAAAALAFFLIAWIPAIVYLIISIRNKDDPQRKKKIIISSVVIVASLGFLIISLVLGAMSGISAEWPKTEYEVSETVQIPIATTPEGTTTDRVALCDSDIAWSTWDEDTQTVTVYFREAGSEELYFIGDGLYETEPVLITVTEPEEVPEDVTEEPEEPEEIATEASEPEEQAESEEIAEEPVETPSEAPESADQPVQEEPTGEMVWITDGGSKYHNDPSCSNMKNPSEVTIERAVELGKEPCSKCY